jgi:hypothetical protein
MFAGVAADYSGGQGEEVEGEGNEKDGQENKAGRET